MILLIPLYCCLLETIQEKHIFLTKEDSVVKMKKTHLLLKNSYYILLLPFFKKKKLFIYLFIFGCVGSSFLCEGLLQLRQAGASRGKPGPLFIVVRGPLTIAASLAAEHRLQTRRLSSCGSRA